jgi:hypothetical protein
MENKGFTNRRQKVWRIALFMIMLNLWIPLPLPAQSMIYVGQFSSLGSNAPLPPEWKPLTFAKITSHTQYSLVKDGGTKVVKAVSKSSASGLIRKIRIDIEKHPIIRWRWKALNILRNGDVTKKKGDDYPARIYVTFEYDPKTAGIFETALINFGRLIYGEDPPISTINYIWANKAPVGTIVQSPYTKLDKMIVVETGEALLNHWVTEERNILDDYIMAFGETPPPVSGVAIMTDSDNTKESAIAFYGDILFRQK